MSVVCAFVLASIGIADDGLDEARSLLRRGLLQQAEQRLAPMLADDSTTQRRAHVQLLMGNVDFERGNYAQALERYASAERDAAGEPSLVATVSGNRIMAEQRLARGRVIAGLASRLRSAVAATIILATVAIAWLGRRSRIRDSA